MAFTFWPGLGDFGLHGDDLHVGFGLHGSGLVGSYPHGVCGLHGVGLHGGGTLGGTCLLLVLHGCNSQVEACWQAVVPVGSTHAPGAVVGPVKPYP